MSEAYSGYLDGMMSQAANLETSQELRQTSTQKLEGIVAHLPASRAVEDEYPKAHDVRQRFITGLDPSKGGVYYVLGWSRTGKTNQATGLLAMIESDPELNRRVEETGRKLYVQHVSGGEGVPEVFSANGEIFNGDYSPVLEEKGVGAKIRKKTLQIFLDKIKQSQKQNDKKHTVVTVAEYMPLDPVVSAIGQYYYAVLALLTNPELQKIGVDIQEAINRQSISGLRSQNRIHRQRVYDTTTEGAIAYLKDKQGNASAVYTSMTRARRAMVELANSDNAVKMAEYRGITVEQLLDEELFQEVEPMYLEDLFRMYEVDPAMTAIVRPPRVKNNVIHPGYVDSLKRK